MAAPVQQTPEKGVQKQEKRLKNNACQDFTNPKKRGIKYTTYPPYLLLSNGGLRGFFIIENPENQ